MLPKMSNLYITLSINSITRYKLHDIGIVIWQHDLRGLLKFCGCPHAHGGLRGCCQKEMHGGGVPKN